ncbi:MAG TPA: hypothetical protein PLD62_02430, partial [Candidatus Cloacimonadota bacterium]|nr:hypothetical protein [Candidatus Cloacimonadota bacterium]
MKKSWKPILLASGLLMLGLIFSCTDDLKKTTSPGDAVRIEYSACLGLGCLECLTGFSCPENAIKTDERTGINYIDTDLCVQCMECMNIFSCPQNAFRTKPDLIPPAPISDLQANSTAPGTLVLTFTATGDDSTDTSGTLAFRYIFQILNSEGNEIVTDFIPPLPAKIGTEEIWNPIDSLPVAETVTVHLTAVDEAGNASSEAVAQVQIMDYPDVTPPAAVSDLSVENIASDSFILCWTAVGNDNLEGTAASYIIKIHNEMINLTNWESLSEYTQNLVPSSAGSSETLSITGLEQETRYYAAIKAVDAAGNQSELSNIAEAMTTAIPDTEPPAAISDLSAATTETTIELSWTAPGDDGTNGTAQSYEIRYSESEITAANWAEATLISDPPPPQIAGTLQNYVFSAPALSTTY